MLKHIVKKELKNTEVIFGIAEIKIRRMKFYWINCVTCKEKIVLNTLEFFVYGYTECIAFFSFV